MMNSKTNLVCAGIDDGYLWPFLVSIFAAKIHASSDFRVAVGSINGGLSVNSKKIIENFSDLLEVPIEIRDFTLNEELQTTHLNIQIYTRLLWLDNLHENFLWLDADTLPLENWDEVFDLPEQTKFEKTIYAVKDFSIINRMHEISGNAAYATAGDLYFNDGVFLGNPRRWKTLGYIDTWRDLGQKYEKHGFLHHEQDILNFLLAQDKELISSSFNAMVMPGPNLGAKILHFTGNPKPWHFTQDAKRYFIAIESLKHPKKGLGAFGGANWVFEYSNYWQHEEAFLRFCQSNQSLAFEMNKLSVVSKRELMDQKDKIKLRVLNACGKKWL
jgi:lipopolysaccharide biosynthesis glycosyltransferase